MLQSFLDKVQQHISDKKEKRKEKKIKEEKKQRRKNSHVSTPNLLRKRSQTLVEPTTKKFFRSNSVHDCALQDLSYVTTTVTSSSKKRRNTTLNRGSNNSGNTVIDEDSIIHVMNLEDLLVMKPSSEEINSKFEELLSNMNVPDSQKEALREKPEQVKWTMIQNLQLVKEEHPSMRDIITNLSGNIRSFPALASLHLVLRTCPMDTIVEFISLGGLQLLQDILASTNLLQHDKLDTEAKFQQECLKCISALLNTECGLEAFLQKRDIMKNVILVLDSGQLESKKQVLLLLSSVCALTEEGLWLILDAMSHYKLVKREKARFSHLVDSLSQSITGNSNYQNSDENIIAYIVAVLIFINTLCSSADPVTRSQLHQEFINLGLLDIIEIIKTKNYVDDKLSIQIGEFHEEFDDISENNLPDPIQLMTELRSQLSGSEAYMHLTTIIQLLKRVISMASDKTMEIDFMAKIASNLQMMVHLDNQKVDQVYAQINQLQELVTFEHTEIETNKKKLDSILSENEQLQRKLKIFDNLPANDQEYAKRIEEYETKITDLNDQITKGLSPTTPISSNSLDSPENTHKRLKSLDNEQLKILSCEDKSEDMTKEQLVLKVQAMDIKLAKYQEKIDLYLEEINSLKGIPKSSKAPIHPSSPPVLTGILPPPPPPPMGLGNAANGLNLPSLPKSKPSIKVRQLQWDVIHKSAIPKTVFMTCDVAKNSDTALKKFNLAELERLFGVSQQQKDKMVIEVEKPKVISFIDDKKGRVISLALAAQKLQNLEEARQVILGMDESRFALQYLESLTFKGKNEGCAPSKDELSRIMSSPIGTPEYNGVDTLALPDQFIRTMLDIPDLFGRLSCWKYKRTFATKSTEIQYHIQNGLKGIEILRSDSKWLHFLEVVLAVGNYLNSGTSKGGAYGFKISSLLKLKDTKTVDNTSNLLQIVVAHLETHEPEIIEFFQDVSNLDKAARATYTELNTELKALRSGLTSCAEVINATKKANIKGDKFCEMMVPFEAKTKRELEALQRCFATLTEEYNSLARDYNEDPKMCPCDVFFQQICSFAQDFQQALAQLQAKREAQQLKDKQYRQQQFLRQLKAEQKQREKENSKSLSRTHLDFDNIPEPRRKNSRTLEHVGDRQLVDNMTELLYDGSQMRRMRQLRREGIPYSGEWAEAKLSVDQLLAKRKK